MTLNMIKVFARQTWRDEGHANARRIARLPELETAYLALTARVAELEGALWDIIPMTDEISRAPITAERWADRIEERARAALGEAKP